MSTPDTASDASSPTKPVGEPWLILAMDEGVLRREPTLIAARAWMTGLFDGIVLSRHSYGPGAYEYTIGYRGEDSASSAFVERLESAVAGGWDDWLAIPDKYPFPDRPYAQDDSIDRDLMIKQKMRGV